MHIRFLPAGFDRTTTRRLLFAVIVAATQGATIVIVQGDHSARLVVPIWVTSLIGATLLFIDRSDWTRLRTTRIRRIDLAIATALAILAATLRLPNLEGLPSGIHGDEGEFATVGLEIANGDGPALFGVAFLDDPAFYPHLLSVFIDAFGADMAAVRLLSALFGIATIPLFYALMRSFAGRIPAMFAASLLATSAVHIHFSRLAINVIEVPFFACLTLLLVVAGARTRHHVFYLLSGIAAGSAVYFHFGGRLVPLILALTLVSQFLIEHNDVRHRLRGILLAMLGGALVLSPFLAHLASRPEQLTGHVAGRGIWNHWDALAEQYGMSPSNRVGILAEQVKGTFSAFTTEPDPFRGAQFYRFMDAPLLTPPIAALALAGLVVLCLALRSLPARLLVNWFLVPIILASVLTDTAGQAHRLIHPLLPAIAAAALLTDHLVRLIQARTPRRFGPAITVVVVLIPLAAGVWDGMRYFEPWITDRITPAHTAQARCLESLPPGTVAYIAGAPFVRADHGPSRYLGHRVVRHDLGDAIPDHLDRSQTPVVVIVHERERHRIEELRDRYPAAQAVDVERPPGVRALTVVGISNQADEISDMLRACERMAASDPAGD